MRAAPDLDPRFGFALDPVAENLAAKRKVMSARSDSGAQAHLASLVQELEAEPDGAGGAVRRWRMT